MHYAFVWAGTHGTGFMLITLIYKKLYRKTMYVVSVHHKCSVRPHI